MPKITLEHITKRWGKFYAVDDLSMVIEDNAFVTLLGPSGCGKTTTLRMIAGLETPTVGKITIGDRVVFDSAMGINIPANKRKVGFLFQNYALWPNMTVYDNIAFGLSNIKEALPKIDFEAKNAARMAEILAQQEDIKEILTECYDKKGKLDTQKALVKLIDSFTISLATAKKILNYQPDKRHDFKEEINSLKNKAGSARKNKNLNENFEEVKAGQVVTEVRKLTKEEIDLAVRHVARIVKIGMFMDRYPAELSGGQQQRVAIARTLAPEPAVLFMDEPLSNLDAKLRLEMRYELQRLHVETGSTFVYVTHDQMEAMTLATKICLINNGVLQQYAAPLTVYSQPENLFVADFVGNPSINFIEVKAKVKDSQKVELTLFGKQHAYFKFNKELDLNAWFKERNKRLEAQGKERAAAAEKRGYVEKSNKDETFRYHIAKVEEDDFSIIDEPLLTDEDLVLGIRPECIRFAEDGKLDGEIYGAMPTGMESTVKIRLGEFLLTGVVFGNTLFKIGEHKKITIVGDGIMLFDRQSGERIALGSLECL